MSGGDDKNIDLKLSSLSRFGLRGRGRGSSPNTPAHKVNVGGTPKRTFAPNIVSRSAKKEEITDKNHPQFKDKPGRGKLPSRGRRGRGRGRGGDIIQSSGVFSHGIFGETTLARALSGGGLYGGGSNNGVSSKSGISKPYTKGDSILENVDIESDKIFEMMEDKGNIEGDYEGKSGNLMPITLPLASRLTHAIKQDVEIKEETKPEVDNNKFRIKKPIKDAGARPSLEIADLFKPNVPDGQLLFFQLPDTLPIKPISQDEPTKDDSEKMNETDSKDNSREDDLDEHLKRFTFRNVSEGFIGKLRVHKSGKVKMHLGNVSLDLALGTPFGFLQDLISVQHQQEPAEMISLGHVNHRLIGTPDYKALLGSVAIR